MFTTRLIPTSSVTDRIITLGQLLNDQRRLLVPAVSVVSETVPNFSERSKVIPPLPARVELLHTLHTSGIPTLLALRPTFPFTLVSADEVCPIVGMCAGGVTSVLGEIFLMDTEEVIERRLGIPWVEGDRVEHLTFLEQPALWSKRSFNEEIAHARAVSHDYGLPFFMRSGSALRMLEECWDFEGRMADVPNSWMKELSEPDP